MLGPLAYAGGVLAIHLASKGYSRLSYLCDLASDTCVKVQFLAGTAILGSLALVGGIHAIQTLVVYGGVAVTMKACGVWTLQKLEEPC